ncbi:11-beta-hydroxysteroid dehydrogenase-like 5 [Dissostichus eleginoides]|uniref:11-beta-hydroxysteroid dehydrogenase-like 5 n=1 Tax=Dissostichus eleginoides TaxID=100907 RepID=A0AAD9B1Y1_DISEL|nr:11-beta-hydroxysteroid dehydrogenase-like 5 [Dissostichus eleginoides]
MKGGALLSLDTLKEKYTLEKQDFYRYLQRFTTWQPRLAASPPGSPDSLLHHLAAQTRCFTTWQPRLAASPPGSPDSLLHHLAAQTRCFPTWQPRLAASPPGSPDSLLHLTSKA